MKFFVSILILFVVCQTKIHAQKNCLDSLHTYEKQKLYIDELRKYVKDKDSAFIFYSIGSGNIVGVATYKSNGKIYGNEFIFDEYKVITKPLNKKLTNTLKEFYSNRYFENPINYESRFFVDDGTFDVCIYSYNFKCWYIDNSYVLNNKKMLSWISDLRKYARKRQAEFYKKWRKNQKK